MKLSPEDLPESERRIWQQLRTLPPVEKKTLWKLIQRANKDHLCLLPRITSHIHSLENKGLLIKNSVYRGKAGYSYYVMRNAPHLMKKLQAEAGGPPAVL